MSKNNKPNIPYIPDDVYDLIMSITSTPAETAKTPSSEMYWNAAMRDVRTRIQICKQRGVQ